MSVGNPYAGGSRRGLWRALTRSSPPSPPVAATASTHFVVTKNVVARKNAFRGCSHGGEKRDLGKRSRANAWWNESAETGREEFAAEGRLSAADPRRLVQNGAETENSMDGRAEMAAGFGRSESESNVLPQKLHPRTFDWPVYERSYKDAVLNYIWLAHLLRRRDRRMERPIKGSRQRLRWRENRRHDCSRLSASAAWLGVMRLAERAPGSRATGSPTHLTTHP